MILQNYDMSMIRGDTERLKIGCKNYNFQDGDVIEFTVRKTATSPKKVIYKKIETFDDGKAILDILHDDTTSLTFGDYVYDVQLTLSGGTIKTIIPYSPFTLKFEVTYE